jgi:hypothetical protein
MNKDTKKTLSIVKPILGGYLSTDSKKLGAQISKLLNSGEKGKAAAKKIIEMKGVMSPREIARRGKRNGYRLTSASPIQDVVNENKKGLYQGEIKSPKNVFSPARKMLDDMKNKKKAKIDDFEKARRKFLLNIETNSKPQDNREFTPLEKHIQERRAREKAKKEAEKIIKEQEASLKKEKINRRNTNKVTANLRNSKEAGKEQNGLSKMIKNSVKFIKNNKVKSAIGLSTLGLAGYGAHKLHTNKTKSASTKEVGLSNVKGTQNE